MYQFYINPKKQPKGFYYQWILVQIEGKRFDLARNLIRKMGGRYVPPARHPEMPTRNGKIYFAGNVLMEIPRKDKVRLSKP